MQILLLWKQKGWHWFWCCSRMQVFGLNISAIYSRMNEDKHSGTITWFPTVFMFYSKGPWWYCRGASTPKPYVVIGGPGNPEEWILQPESGLHRYTFKAGLWFSEAFITHKDIICHKQDVICYTPIPHSQKTSYYIIYTYPPTVWSLPISKFLTETLYLLPESI